MHMAKLHIVPADTRYSYNVEPQLVEMMVPLYSHGCANKVHKALSHLKGIYSVNVDCNQQKVTVWGICNKYQVLSTVRSKRKAARFWNHETEQEADNSGPVVPPPAPPLSFRPRFAVRSLSLKLACKKVLNLTTPRSYSFRRSI
ncbi:uncharacterized protein LOC111011661 [Momordica charantia]|uniref:Uncharacterized protein LOC111011661 n=1 Tax=Momordica charantia TaxID=3673 RepID=A0A6J1CHX5_MOMCH|nr:uncharacterized protein LOC111011661 [Momordica charantia]